MDTGMDLIAILLRIERDLCTYRWMLIMKGGEKNVNIIICCLMLNSFIGFILHRKYVKLWSLAKVFKPLESFNFFSRCKRVCFIWISTFTNTK